MKHTHRFVYVMLVLAVCLVAACGGGQEQQAEAPEGGAAAPEAPAQEASPDLVAQGQQIFTGKGICFTCHGQDGTGTQLAPNLTDATWLNIEQPATQEKIVNLVRTGVPQPKEHPAPMPPMGGAQLTDQEIQAVAAYVMSLAGSA